MDGQPHVKSDGTEPACGDSNGTAVKIEPKGKLFPGLGHHGSLFGETGTAMAMVQDGVAEVRATGSGDDCDYETAVYTPLGVPQQGQALDLDPPAEEIKPGDLTVFNIGGSLFGQTDIPMAMIQDEEIEVQDTGSGDDGDHETAVYTLLELSQRGQEVHDCDSPGTSAHVCEAPYPSTPQGLWPTTPASLETMPQLGATYGPVYNQPYTAPVPTYGPSAHHPIKQSPQRKVRRPRATWNPYSSAPPQAYHQVSLPAKATGGPGPSTGSAAGTSLYNDLTGGGLEEALAVNGVGASVGSSVRDKDTESGESISRHKNKRDAHNEKERRRRARLKNAWDALREIVPGLSEKMNSASLCEMVAEYTRHQNEVLVARYGKEAADKIAQEFLEKLQPR